MYKYIIFLISFHFIHAEFYNRYPSIPEQEPDEWIQNYYNRKLRTRSVEHNSTENGFENDDQTSVLDTSLVADVQRRITKMKNILNEDFKKISNLDGKNQEMSKKTVGDIKDAINGRVGYVEQLLYKKREEDSYTNPNVIRCVSESLSKLSNITPDLMRDAGICINQEVDSCRAHTKASLEMLKEHLQNVKHHQERLNECSYLLKFRNPCLIKLVQEITAFKKNITTVKPKMAETTSYLNGLPRKLHLCSTNTVSKVVTHASDVVIKFKSCIKGAAIDEEKKQLEEMMLFIV